MKPIRAHRRSYAVSPSLRSHVWSLLDAVFPGFPATVDAASRLGLCWESCSTPFILEKRGRVLSHVGVLEMTFVLYGAERSTAIVHAVATHPEYRRRGYYRAVMTEALAWCDERYESVLLNTGQPELYEPFAFRVVPESRFVIPWREDPGGRGVRPIRYDSRQDVELLRALLQNREPVSRRFGVVRETQAFAFNETRRPPHYAEALDALVCMELSDAVLQIYDVVARRMPTLREIMALIHRPVTRVECYLTADQLDAGLTPERHVLFGDEFLMVRGPFPPEGKPLMLARPARC